MVSESVSPCDDALLEALARYEAALRTGDRLAVAAARLRLCLSLMSTGWQPPEPVRSQMDGDEKVLRRAAEPQVDAVLWLTPPPSHSRSSR